MKQVIHKILAFFLGECPFCGHIGTKDVEGWNEATCPKCNRTFNYWG